MRPVGKLLLDRTAPGVRVMGSRTCCHTQSTDSRIRFSPRGRRRIDTLLRLQADDLSQLCDYAARFQHHGDDTGETQQPCREL
jgi:hypothetical protein